MEKLPFENKKSKILLKKAGKPSPRYGKDPNQRSVEELISCGIINLNKPRGPTSHQVSAFVQQILGIPKSGHSGTLDPNVTGVLPVATEKATRVAEALLKAGKEYVCLMHVHKEIPEEQLKKTAERFVGRIKQLPPLKSSVKRAWRFRTIYYLYFMEINGKEVLFKVGCQSGTYIRKLVHDFGQSLGCGANMVTLVRTKAGPFSLNESFSLQDLADALWYYKNQKVETFIRKVILPIEAGVSHLSKIWVLDSTVDSLCHGSSLGVPGIAKLDNDVCPEDMVAIMTLKDELIGIATATMTSKQIINEQKGIAAKIDKVFMERSTYPKMSRGV